MKQLLKRALFRILGKHREAVVVCFWSGDAALAGRMADEIRGLVPDYRHFNVALGSGPEGAVVLKQGSIWALYRQLRRHLHLRGFRVGLAPVLFTAERSPLRLTAFLLAPGKILAYNSRLERHHLRLRHAVASWLFVRGVALDRIYLRPRWLYPWKRDRSTFPSTWRVVYGQPFASPRRRIAVLSPYFPYPLSHGGAVRIFSLLREAAREFDIVLFAFIEGETDEACRVLAEFCSVMVLVEKPRYREPRWSTLLPPEVCEFRSSAMRRALQELRRKLKFELLQVEYTQLGNYTGDILVEHDITFDLFRQVWMRDRSLAARWNYWRWLRFERRALSHFARAVVMSEKDAAQLDGPTERIRIIENGVDLERFQPEPEKPGQRILFIGSFRHFPNVAAYRFFTGEVWPKITEQFPQAELTVVAGPDHLIHWRAFTDRPEPSYEERIRILGFVRDVRPLYIEANLVVVPTTVSAGTNIKTIEAMAMRRAIVSTSSGCAGLRLEHGRSVWIANDAAGFASGVALLLSDPNRRAAIAENARKLAESHFDWRALGARQRALYRELLDLKEGGAAPASNPAMIGKIT